MTSKTPAKHEPFGVLLAEVKQRIQAAQTHAIISVNSELMRLYWDIGRIIDARQKNEGWGAAVIPRLAQQLKNELPELKGFSERNIKRMLAFHREYPDPASIVTQGAAQITDSLLWAIPWFHHIVLMEKVKDFSVRRWYMEQTLVNGWSRNILTMQIDTQAHVRCGKAQSNFALTLPSHQSDLVQQTLKDPYIFDFLTLTEPFQERELETGLVRQLEKFLLELGQGFAFVGRQYKVEVADEDFYIDLLFYHLRLRAFVVIELKKGQFKPEYAGKLNFYCNVVNKSLKQPTDQPTIGLILCQEHSRLLAEYSFTGIDKPIGVSTYELTRALPKSMKSVLPTVEEIEVELSDLTKYKAKHPRTRSDRCDEDFGKYAESSVWTANHPFDAGEVTDTPLGRRWHAGTTILTNDQIAALEKGETLALDVREEYLLFLKKAVERREEKPKRRK